LRAARFAPNTDPATFDYETSLQSENASIALTEAADIAGLRRIPALVPVHLLEREGELKLIVLPIRGVGYQSTIKA
ncbi:MAG: NADH:ubiquinone reductase (Na(+)-transporting) subunit C, partial [Xanthomonadales bacterium]|nr:NADH:ubiquinone reductase (Na(+)-transporting) subunit C [Xanthomonadales bacterium]